MHLLSVMIRLEFIFGCRIMLFNYFFDLIFLCQVLREKWQCRYDNSALVKFNLENRCFYDKNLKKLFINLIK